MIRWKVIRKIKDEEVDPNQIGDVRTIRRFLWIPTCIDDEWRWLGTCSIIQMYVMMCVYSWSAPTDILFPKWENMEWLDG